MSLHTASFPAVDKPAYIAKRPAGLVYEALRQWADDHRHWLLALVIVFYLLAFTGKWQPESDSALYLSLGKSLATGNGYTELGQPNHLVYPGLPWMIAGTFKIFGVDHLLPIHIVLLFFAAVSLIMIYAMIQRRVDRPTAVIVTTIVALSDTFFRYSMKILTDMPFMAGVMAVLLGCELIGWYRRADTDPLVRRENPIAGWILIIAGLALATIMRPVIWALLLTLIAAAVVTSLSKKGSWKFGLIALVGVLIISGFFTLDPRRNGNSGFAGGYESSVIYSLRSGEMFHHLIHDNLLQVIGGTTTEALLGMRVGPGLNQIVAIVAILVGVGIWRRQPLWGVWVA
ncbi:MAG TPA: glycosyltransferase family 39 protein, partial [Tepidisphaeraceae bacterium]